MTAGVMAGLAGVAGFGMGMLAEWLRRRLVSKPEAAAPRATETLAEARITRPTAGAGWVPRRYVP